MGHSLIWLSTATGAALATARRWRYSLHRFSRTRQERQGEVRERVSRAPYLTRPHTAAPRARLSPYSCRHVL
eukprot:5021060-Prymnesium_polylepis.1